MGRSFIQFRGRRFVTSDDAIRVFLALIVREIDTLHDVPAWLRETRDEWNLQVTEGFGFGVMPGLDRFVTDDDRRDTLVTLSRRALARVEAFGPIIPRDALDALNTGGEGVVFDCDVPAEIFAATGRDFVQLLDGTLP